MPRKPAPSAFVKAILGGTVKRVRNMCRAGASVTRPDKFGWLPIHRAAGNDQGEKIRLLLEWGSPIEPTGTENWTPLHLACVSASPSAVTVLLTHGANVNAKSIYGDTPLHLAVGSENILSITSLLRAGADMRASDVKGKNPLQRACEYGNQEIVALLEGHDREGYPALNLAPFSRWTLRDKAAQRRLALR